MGTNLGWTHAMNPGIAHLISLQLRMHVLYIHVLYTVHATLI